MIAATLELSAAAREVWDVVVVGAGPAGSVAARELARRGRSVLLVDRAAFPRSKVCGCCLNGRALATLQSVGLGGLAARCGAVPTRRLQLAAGGRTARVALAEGVALSREAFDAALVREAIGAGADFLPQTRAVRAASVGERQALLTSTRGSDQMGVTLVQGGGSLATAARVVLAADGLGGVFHSQTPALPGARIGMGAVAAGAAAFYQPGTIYMACGARGYLGLVRLEDGRLDLAAAVDAAWLREAGGPGAVAAELLAEVGWPLPSDVDALDWRGTPPLTRCARRPAPPRAFVLGDAAGYVEPFTGEGMAWALAAAVAVAPLADRAAVAWQPSLEREWEQTYRRVVGRRQWACRAAAAVLRRPWLTRACVGMVSRWPRLAGPVVYHLNGRRTRFAC
jgi:flavin-dependent dehydrogenase